MAPASKLSLGSNRSFRLASEMADYALMEVVQHSNIRIVDKPTITMQGTPGL